MPPPNSLPPPHTPTRALLQRLRRRSSLAPGQGGGGAPAAMPSPIAPAAAANTPQSLRRAARSSLRHEISAEDDGQESDDDDDDDEEEDDGREQVSPLPATSAPTDEEMATMDEDAIQAALESQVDTLLNLAEEKDQRILALERDNAALTKQLREAKETIKLSEKRESARDRAGVKEKGGLTRQAAIQLEREFASQELILQGLQRDNERKTIEVEALRRKVRQMGDYLSSRHFGGTDDWEAAVFGSSGAGTSGSNLTGSSVAPSAWAGGVGGGNTGNFTLSSAAGAADVSLTNAASSQISPVARLLGAAAAGGPTPPSLVPLSALKDFGNTSMEGSPRRSAKGREQIVDVSSARAAQSPLKKAWKLSDAEGGDESSFVSASDEQENRSVAIRRASIGDEDTDDDDDEGEQDAAIQTTASAPTSASQQLTAYDPATLLASIEAARLLIAGFERRNALRATELEDALRRAAEAERRSLELLELHGGGLAGGEAQKEKGAAVA